LQSPLVADTTQQCFECFGRGEWVAQFHVGVPDMWHTLYSQVSLIIFHCVWCIVYHQTFAETVGCMKRCIFTKHPLLQKDGQLLLPYSTSWLEVCNEFIRCRDGWR